MRSKVRLIVTSYVVVLAGCSHAGGGTQAPVAYRGEVVQQGGPLDAAPVPVRLPRARVSDSDTLSVRVTGPAAVASPGVIHYTAAVRNGSASRHYYWWFVASCAKTAGCAPSSYRLLAEGEGRTAVEVPFADTHVERDIVVQVAEIDGDGQTGSSAEFAVSGPKPARIGARRTTSRAICDWFAGEFYPHTGMYTDPFTGRTWERGFRRDYCSNRLAWSPDR